MTQAWAIAIAVPLAAIILCCCAGFCFAKRRKNQRNEKEEVEDIHGHGYDGHAASVAPARMAASAAAPKQSAQIPDAFCSNSRSVDGELNRGEPVASGTGTADMGKFYSRGEWGRGGHKGRGSWQALLCSH